MIVGILVLFTKKRRHFHAENNPIGYSGKIFTCTSRTVEWSDRNDHLVRGNRVKASVMIQMALDGPQDYTASERYPLLITHMNVRCTYSPTSSSLFEFGIQSHPSIGSADGS
ncbi:hypothetical protein KQX54_002039 [Cotesia glomerata]|uniref:Uncharacterized protein n=1 Tax=Cotesia glomerata TaxID=32391 RepID=A0AAV7IMB5_COTGL|nr:hypothetical protein KQX54_002039 [Cotesia glomerata]